MNWLLKLCAMNKPNQKLNWIFFLFILTGILSNEMFCQNDYLDSLINKVDMQEDDISKVENLITISRMLSGINKEKAITYSKQAALLSSKLNYSRGFAGSYFAIGLTYWKSGDNDSAIFFLEKAIRINDSIEEYKHLAQNYEVYALLYIYSNQPEPAVKKLNKSLHYFNKANDSSGIVGIYNSFGLLYKSIAKYDSAVYYYVKLLSLSRGAGNENVYSAGIINLGNIYLHLGEFEKAEKYFLESVDYSKKINRIDHLATAYKSLGTISSNRNDFNSALEYYKLSTELHEQLNNPSGLVSLYLAIGSTYEEQNRYNNAFEYYSKGVKLADEIEDMDGVIVGLLNQGLIYMKWNNYIQALSNFDTCVLLAKSTSDLENLKSAYLNIYLLYKQRNDYKNAFIYQTKYHEINDSIFNIEKAELIADLTLNYEKEKDQARILILENENLVKDLSLRKRTNQRNIYLFGGSGIILIILFLFIFYRNKSRKDRIIADQKIKQLEEEKKLLAARFLVEGQEEERKRIAKELHDGLGVLLSTAKMQFTTIKDKSPENKSLIEKAAKLLEQATGDVRKISHNMMPGLLTKFGLYEAAEGMLDQLDETEGLSATCEIIGDTKRLSENTEIMLYRIIQEMVNNTLKHADATTISLKMDILPELLKINYSDDGKGFDVEEKLKSKSIGLTSVQSRVNFLSGNVNLMSEPGKGTNYSLQIPIKIE